MRRLLLVTAFAVLASPGAGATPASGLRGVVMRGPTMPVCRVDQPCEEPAVGVTLIFTRNAHSERVRTGARGVYRVALAPGVYTVRLPGTLRIGRGLEPRSVRVRPSVFRRVDFHIDTGIR